MRLRLAMPAVVLIVAGVLAACSDDGSDTSASTTDADSESTADSPAAPEPGSTATPTPSPPTPTSSPSDPPPDAVAVPELLDFTAPTVDGGTFDGASLAGTPAVIWFWAPWCPVCQREAPLIADLAGQYDGDVSFVGVAGLSGDLNAMEDFITNGGVQDIPHIDDRDGEIYSRFGVTQQYDVGFVSADGSVDVVTGPLSEDEIVSRVENLAAG